MPPPQTSADLTLAQGSFSLSPPSLPPPCQPFYAWHRAGDQTLPPASHPRCSCLSHLLCSLGIPLDPLATLLVSALTPACPFLPSLGLSLCTPPPSKSHSLTLHLSLAVSALYLHMDLCPSENLFQCLSPSYHITVPLDVSFPVSCSLCPCLCISVFLCSSL